MADDNLLHGIYLFKELSALQIETVGEVVEKSKLAAAEDVFEQDSVATALYIIKSGSIRIHQKASTGDNIEVAVLGSGSHFGEMAFVDNENRSATATAIEETELITISYDRLNKMLSQNPEIAVHFYKALSNFLCGRLRITTNDLSFARERNLRFF